MIKILLGILLGVIVCLLAYKEHLVKKRLDNPFYNYDKITDCSKCHLYKDCCSKGSFKFNTNYDHCSDSQLMRRCVYYFNKLLGRI